MILKEKRKSLEVKTPKDKVRQLAL